MLHLCARSVPRSGCRVWSAGRAAVAGASPQASAGADAHEEPVAAMALSQACRKIPAVDEGGAGGVGAVALAAVAAERRSTAAARRLQAEIRDWTGGWRRSAAAAGGGAADDASRSRSGNRLGLVLTLGPADDRSAKQVGSYFGLIPSEDPAAENSGWAGSANRAVRFCAFCWWKRDRRGAVGSAAETLLSSPGGAQESQVAKVAVARKLPRGCT